MKRAAIAGLCATAFLLFAQSCGSNSTTGHPVQLHTQLVADPEIDRAFETDTGWSVRIEKAALSIRALYYFDGEPAFVMHRQKPLLERLASLWRTPVARAHPGHYIEGTALGQMTESVTSALSSEPVAIPEGSGLTGLYRSARFGLAQADDAPEGLGSDVAMLEGRATKDGVTVYFKLSASYADVSRSVSKGEVNGCTFDQTEIERDGTVTVTVKPHIWLDLVDFVEVEPGSAQAPTEVARGETAQIAFALGVVQLSAYHFSYSADAK